MDEIHRTTFTLEVFSEGPLQLPLIDNDPFQLRAIHDAIYDGDCIGSIELTSDVIIPPEALKGELLRIDNDGTFFEEIT